MAYNLKAPTVRDVRCVVGVLMLPVLQCLHPAPDSERKLLMIVTLALDTEFFADKMFRSLIERFFQSEITHTEVAAILNQQPEQISAILGAIFIVALRSTNPLTRLNIFPELSVRSPIDVEKAHLMAAGLTEDLADSLLVIMCEGAESLLLSELTSSLPTPVDGSTIEPEKDEKELN
jgi:hypothetical protein